ncbi:ester cyclase [Streptomyces sp. NPDC048057]|uniref:ester cyclase n=1 Tax=Streptomyces sp. NPDC048057 TaxID=3155628 RepID=UPI0033EE93C7
MTTDAHPTAAPPPADATGRNMALLRTAFATLQDGDVDAVYGMLTEDFVANLPGLPEPLRGREHWRPGVAAMHEAFPDLRIDVEELFAAGDRVATRVRMHGTHEGTFQGVPATHRPVSFHSIELYRMEGDKIAEEWVAPDMATLMQQITG